MSLINEQEQDRSQITKVISLGRDQNYLTYSQINDLLPNIVDTEHFGVIISMLEGMNIKVFERPPDDDELALLSNTEEEPDDIEEAASVVETGAAGTGMGVEGIGSLTPLVHPLAPTSKSNASNCHCFFV